MFLFAIFFGEPPTTLRSCLALWCPRLGLQFQFWPPGAVSQVGGARAALERVTTLICEQGAVRGHAGCPLATGTSYY